VDVSAEPTNGMVLFGRGAAVGAESALMFHSGLTVWDENSNVTPRLAERVPSLQNGDWKVAPDGSMEVTWRLRADARWHDGTPLTAEDFVFGHTIRTDRAFAVTTGPPTRLIDSIVATDPHTFVVRWKQPYVFANVSGPEDFPALPRHLMESVYQQGDKDAFLASLLWNSGWVGLGPYRVGNWSLGSQLEALAFDQYLLGKPKIDRIIIQYYGEPNAAMSALMSGAVDMTPVGSTYVLDQMVNVKRAWDPIKGGTTLAIPRGVRNLKVQFRDPSAPWARDASIRRALVYATDRQTFVDTLGYGLTTPAYTAVTTDDPVFALLRQRGLIEESRSDDYEAVRSRQEFLSRKHLLEEELEDQTRLQRERDRASGRLDRMSVREREDWARQQNTWRDQQQSRRMAELFSVNYKPNVELKYTDDHGRSLDQKEAFKHLSHQFHGKGSGKGKTEKRLKKIEDEKRREAQSLFDAGRDGGMSAATAQQLKKRREAGVRLG